MRRIAAASLMIAIFLLGAGVLSYVAPSDKRIAVSPCTDRVFLAGKGGYSWGSFTRWRGGHLTAFHVIDSGAVQSGPNARAQASLPATDFAFLSGAPANAVPETAPPLQGRVTLEGYPARATQRVTVEGDVYAPDTTPPGVWIALDHPEPLVGGFSGGCVRNAAGEVVAIIMGASSMKLSGETRHFARVIPIRAALAEHQGQPLSAPVALLLKPVPLLQRWPEQRSIR